MLHEVLLALSGHPSPLFDRESSESFPFTNPAEESLLAAAGHLAGLHRWLKDRLSTVSHHHPSIICRAVASSIISSHFSRFQQAILEVESQILRKDAATVGAYNIVPLAGVIRSFDGWKRKLEWYSEIACFMLPDDGNRKISPPSKTLSGTCSGPQLLEKLRASSITGYTDIEDAAVTLTIVAEHVWIRLLSTWLLSGQLSTLGDQDFFIARTSKTRMDDYSLQKALIPPFLTTQTATSILFIGKTLNFLEAQTLSLPSDAQRKDPSRTEDPGRSTGFVHGDTIRLLKAVTTPIKPALLASAISNIRKGLSQRVSEEMLPTHELIGALTKLRKFFLAGHGYFDDALILEADKHLRIRHQQTRVGPLRDDLNNLAGVMMKEGELKTILGRTWATMTPAVSNGEVMNDEIEWGRDHLSLMLWNSSSLDTGFREATRKPAGTVNLEEHSLRTFSDLLLSTPAVLTFNLEPRFDLLFARSDLHLYSVMHTLLLVIRRGQHHINTLWRQRPLRRSEPLPSIFVKGNSSRPSERRKQELAARTKAMRKIWASSKAAVFALSELGAYFEGEVVARSWQKFYSWALQSEDSSSGETTTITTTAPSSFLHAMSIGSEANIPMTVGAASVDHSTAREAQLPRDPETLMQAHQQYLAGLVEALLLDDETLTKSLRSLLSHIDQLVGFVDRLLQAQQSLDLHSSQPNDYLQSKYAREEAFLHGEAVKSSTRLEDDIRKLIERLRVLSTARQFATRTYGSNGEFEPWNSSGGLDRLLIRLDFRLPDEDLVG